MEKRTFLLCDDDHPDFFVGGFTRTEDQVKPELWALEVGQFLPGTEPNRSITRQT